MFHKSDLYGRKMLQKILLHYNTIWYGIILFVVSIEAGQFITSDFSNVTDSSNVKIYSDSVLIAARDIMIVSILKDTQLTNNTIDSSYATEVINVTQDTFAFFWIEYSSLRHNVYSRKVKINEFNYNFLNQQPIVTGFSLLAMYLHSTSGTNPSDFVTTFYDSLAVIASDGADSVKFTSKPNSSLCHVANDTFCIVYKNDNTALGMRKVELVNGKIEFADTTIPSLTISTNALGPPGNFSNSSIAADSSGNIFIIVTRGGAVNQKDLKYILTNTNYTINETGNIASAVSLNTTGDILYADAPLVSYADKKFAAVYWKSSGVYLYSITIAGNPPSVNSPSTQAIVTGDSYRAPTIATNGSQLLVVWKNLTTRKIEGKLISIINGAISSIPSKTFNFSDPLTTISDDGPELNAAINEYKSIAIAWKQDQNAVGCLWAEREVLYPNGEFTSVVESVSVTIGDSIMFLPGALNTVLKGGSVVCSLQVGPSNNILSGWTNWLPISSATILEQNTRDTNNYFRFKVNLTRDSTDSLASPKLSQLTVNWNLKPRVTSFDSVKVNGILVSGFSGFNDTINILSEIDTLDCYFTIHDGDIDDSIFATIPWVNQSEQAKDTITGVIDRIAALRLMPSSVWDTIYNCTINAIDNYQWDATSKNITIKSRKEAPVITTVTLDGSSINNNSTANIVIGKSTLVQVAIERLNIVDWNKIEYRFITNTFDTSFNTASQLLFQPSENDTNMRIITTDMFGSSDTFFMLFVYPKYSIDSINNPSYFQAKKKLSDSISFILGKDIFDTILLPILNTGNDTLIIDSILFNGSDQSWFNLGVVQDTGVVYYDSLTNLTKINPISIPPNTSSSLYVVLNTSNLIGDNILAETLYVYNNDPLYLVDTIPITLEYNDLPTMLNLSFDYKVGTPYWLNRKKAILRNGYIFPPHANIKLSFSEPMDSVNASNKIIAYSVFDFTTNGRIDTIIFNHSWQNNYTTLLLEPVYNIASSYFNGLKPSVGMFIPTDSITIVISSDLTDRASTPSSPNYLDINNDYINQSGTDTSLFIRVDSINFTLNSVSPNVSETDVVTNDSIVLTFSTPIYPGTIDQSSVNNRSLIIKTRFNSYLDSNKQVAFETVYITGNKVVFKPKKRFFFNDSVYCYYKGVSVRDTLGYSIDMNNDGIPIGLFDSSSVADDYFWSFHIENILADSVFPDSGAREVSYTTPIKLTFKTPLFPGVIDTKLSGNRSLNVTSRYSEGNPINFDSIIVGTNSATFYLNHNLFYLDSIFCKFNGLLTKDTTVFSVDMGNDSVYLTGIGREWFFIVEELKVVSVSPDSGKSGAGIHDPVTINFSGPISTVLFDTCTEADSNRSFFFKTSYSDNKRLPLSSIRFSNNDRSVTISTEKKYFSYDSIYCEFAGYVNNYSYHRELSLIPTDTSNPINSYSWYFLTGNFGFYTYPNPYKPGSFDRHRELGGIWFKNLHALSKLRGAITDIKVRIFNINTHPVFESNIIHFKEGDTNQKPLWFWDTKNSQGSLIASGVYLYAIYDLKENVLLKGKILIVR